MYESGKIDVHHPPVEPANVQLKPGPGRLALPEGSVPRHGHHGGRSQARLDAGVRQGWTQDDAKRRGDVVLGAHAQGRGEPLGFPTHPYQRPLQEVGETGDGLDADAGHVIATSTGLQDSQDAVVGPRQVLELH